MLSTIISTSIAKATRESLENKGLSEEEINAIMFKNLLKAIGYIIIGVSLLFLIGNYIIEPILKFIFVDTWSFEIHF